MRITESNLRSLIRETLLTEAMVTPESAKQMGLTFAVNSDGESVEVVVWKGDRVIGELTASRSDNPCSGAYSVTWADASISGVGPLLYDLMIDAIHPAPLSSDREEVSPDAKRVWDFYLRNRPDIEAVQLDDLRDTLTPIPDDNCTQISSSMWGDVERTGWKGSSLSKAYRRKDGRTPTLNALWQLDILEMN
jgi:hypothetical protein